jgi:hypothetical protein
MERNLLYVSGTVNYDSYYGKIVWRFLKKLKIELLYDPAILLLATYSKGMNSVYQRDMCIPLFLSVLLITPNRWR